MKVESVFVTGANRGIGLEFVKQLSQLADPPIYIFASYRNANTLKNLKEIEASSKKAKIILIKMDITCPLEVASAQNLVEGTLGERGLNLLINNAGAGRFDSFPNITPERLNRLFKINTEGSLMVLQSMMPCLEKAAQMHGGVSDMSVSKAAVLNMTSFTGSITNTGNVFTEDLAFSSYKVSKAALNMAMRIAAANTKDKGILVVMMCPGWVKTDLGGKDKGELEPEESIASMIRTLLTLNESHHGCYMDRLGKPYPF